MEGKQLAFDDLFTPASPASKDKPKAGEKEEAIDKDFLIGAALLIRRWGIPKKTQQLALGILHGSKLPNKTAKRPGK